MEKNFARRSDTLQTLKFLDRNIYITYVFKSVVLATLKSSKTKALTRITTLSWTTSIMTKTSLSL